MRSLGLIWFSFWLSLSLLFTSRARAEVLQAPIGAKAFPLGTGLVGCKPVGGGFQLEDAGASVRPPSASESIGAAIELKVAADAAACATSQKSITLVATDHIPLVDMGSIVLYPDDARLEMKGRALTGVGVAWRTSGASGADVCRDPKPDGAQRACAWAVGRNLSANPDGLELSLVPAGGRSGPDVTTFDADGHALGADALKISPSRVILTRLIPADAAVDLSTGLGEIPLAHPEVTSAVDCAGASCTLSNGKIVVRGQSNLVSSVDVKLKLVPRVFYKKGDTTDAQPTLRLSVLHCPMSVASGRPLRGVDSARAVVKFEGRCAKDVQALHFFAGSDALEVIETQSDSDVAWVVLHLGSVDSATLSITAVRADLEGIPVAVARTETQTPPAVRSSLEIPGQPNLPFIPNNRSAVVHVAPVGGKGRLVVLPVEGVYSAEIGAQQMTVEGDPYAAGLTALRFAYRDDSLPAPLNQVDLATLVDPLQRTIHEANIPAPIDLETSKKNPLLEVLCSDDHGQSVRLIPGRTEHLPYASRDSCRLVLHRTRLSPEYGTQKLSLEVDVLRSDGSPRSEAHVSQTLIVKAGKEPRIAWIHGVAAPFDRIVVKLSHVADEAHYIGANELLTGEPALKWTAVLGTGHARLYATTAIPTGLYRFGDANHSGVLSLNFGVISRLTWLDSEGHEGFLGLEGGLMVIGLAGAESTTGQSLTQVGAVAGLGVSVPIANRSSPTEASINLHGWFERDLEAAGANSSGRHWSFIFGPSISIGNVGTNL